MVKIAAAFATFRLGSSNRYILSSLSARSLRVCFGGETRSIRHRSFWELEPFLSPLSPRARPLCALFGAENRGTRYVSVRLEAKQLRLSPLLACSSSAFMRRRNSHHLLGFVWTIGSVQSQGLNRYDARSPRIRHPLYSALKNSTQQVRLPRLSAAPLPQLKANRASSDRVSAGQGTSLDNKKSDGDFQGEPAAADLAAVGSREGLTPAEKGSAEPAKHVKTDAQSEVRR